MDIEMEDEDVRINQHPYELLTLFEELNAEHLSLLWDRYIDKVESERTLYMGDEFKHPPLEEFDVVFGYIQNRQSRIKRLEELNAPKVIIDNEKESLGKLIDDMKKGRYILTDVEREYSKKYIIKENEFSYRMPFLICFDHENIFTDLYVDWMLDKVVVNQ